MIQVLQKSELALGLTSARLPFGLLHGVLVSLAVLTEKYLGVCPIAQRLLDIVLLVKQRVVPSRALKLTLHTT